ARQAAHVTMLQRSPTYVVSRPAEDRLANWLRARLPGKAAYRITRWKNVLTSMVYYRLAKTRPAQFRARLLAMVRGHLGPDYDVERHFTPRYDPWDQRLCLVPDADLFASLKRGDASVVTGTIERFTETGIRLGSGEEIPADVIVTATGLRLQWLSDIRFTRDGAPIAFDKTLQYKGMMFSDVPNLAYTFGYTNASWTLKAELVATYVCRLLNTMRQRGLRQATPRLRDPAMATEPFVDFTSGYIQRAAHLLPQQGSRKPWKLNQNYVLDVVALRFGSIDDDMVFDNPEPGRRDAA
ncbi:MAG: NAD(P)/FAD-dependent oxidoreductase, partial [Sphingomonas sp.]